MNRVIKNLLCKVISAEGVVTQPHTSEYTFIKDKCTVSLLTLVSEQTYGMYVTMVAYGLKMENNGCRFLYEFHGLDL